MVGHAIGLYAPSLQSLGSPKLAPKRGPRSGGCARDLYAPSLPASGSFELEPPQQPPTDCQVAGPLHTGVSDFRPVRDGDERVFGIGLLPTVGTRELSALV